MSDKLHFYTTHFIFFIVISLLGTLPTFAQSVKPRTNQPTKSQTESALMLTPNNLKKEAYKMWFYWYKAKQQGKAYPQPTLDIPGNLDAKEANQVRAVWQQAQQRAQHDVQQSQGQIIKKMDMASAYKIWADWYLAQQQGIHIARPNLIVSNVDEKESQQVNAIWEQARLKAQRDIQGQVARNSQPQQPAQLNNKPQNIQTASAQLNNAAHLSNAVANGTPNTRLFAGQEYDPDLGFYYLRSRFLNTATGRFLTQDKFPGSTEDPQSLHKYLYVANDPVNKVDPTGRFGIATIATGIGINNILSAISTLGFVQILSPDGNIEFGKALLNPMGAGNLITQPGFDGGAQYELTMGDKYCKQYDISDETLDTLDLNFSLNIEFKFTPNVRITRDTWSSSDPTSTFFRRSTITENGQILEVLGRFDRASATVEDNSAGKGNINLRFITTPFLPNDGKGFKVNRDGTSKFVFQLAGFNTSGRKVRKSSAITIK
ncbi:MAG: RHS repeat-associated core domain-containing protein, partial [bacterium]